MKYSNDKQIITLMLTSLLLFFISSGLLGLTEAEFINRILYSVLLYAWAIWVYHGRRRFYKFFTSFVLVVYAFGFISTIFVPSFNYLTISQIVLSIFGIIINVGIIAKIFNNKRKMISHD